MRAALLLGRFHAVTHAQARWLESLAAAPVDVVVCVVTSANVSGTRRNPLPCELREAMLRPALEKAGKPMHLVRVDDVPESGAGVAHVLAAVQRETGLRLTPHDTTVHSSNRDVAGLFAAAQFHIVGTPLEGLTPHELVQQVVDGAPWEAHASDATRRVYGEAALQAKLRSIFRQTLLNDDGELGHLRDFASYGAQMDASLRQKLEDLLPFVRPGCIVDKGCGTGKLLVELSRLFPTSQLVGVDLSRELLRVCDENTYASQDVSLVFGNVIEASVPPGTATTVIFSSVMHEVHSYSGYDVTQIERALKSAWGELGPGGRVLVRDGVSPEPATWRLELLTDLTRETFQRFAREFRHGRGVPFEQLDERTVRLSSHDANEFLCKKDYLTNWHIEVHEEFGPLTAEGWRQALRRAGFEPIQVRTTANPWILEHRYQGTVRVLDDAGRPLDWPATNVVVAGARVG